MAKSKKPARPINMVPQRKIARSRSANKPVAKAMTLHNPPKKTKP